MENETSFNLNQAIQQWRENLAQSPTMRAENLNELESHLRDSIATLQSRALSEEEAFLIATRRLGADRQLETEYGKVNGSTVWFDRIFWILVGLQLWGLVSTTIESLTFTSLAFGWKLVGYDYRVSGLALPVILSTLVRLLTVAAGFAFCWWVLTRKARNVGHWLQPFLRRRLTFAVSCAAIWAMTFLPRVFMPMVFTRLYGQAAFNNILPSLSYSQGIAFLIQVMAMVIITLVLARKRLGIRSA